MADYGLDEEQSTVPGEGSESQPSPGSLGEKEVKNAIRKNPMFLAALKRAASKVGETPQNSEPDLKIEDKPYYFKSLGKHVSPCVRLT